LKDVFTGLHDIEVLMDTFPDLEVLDLRSDDGVLVERVMKQRTRLMKDVSKKLSIFSDMMNLKSPLTLELCKKLERLERLKLLMPLWWHEDGEADELDEMEARLGRMSRELG
jgi:hypothetical protein